MHQVFTRMHSTVSKVPSYMESPTGFSQDPLPTQTPFHHISLQNFFLLLLSPNFFFTEPSELHPKDKQIFNWSEKFGHTTFFCFKDISFFLKILLVSTSQITICKIHHKQSFSLLAPTWNKEVIKFRLRSSNDYKFHGLITLTHPHTPLPNQILNFHQVPEELTRISGVTQKTFRTTAASSLPW